jgi:hypothetical protein
MFRALNNNKFLIVFLFFFLSFFFFGAKDVMASFDCDDFYEQQSCGPGLYCVCYSWATSIDHCSCQECPPCPLGYVSPSVSCECISYSAEDEACQGIPVLAGMPVKGSCQSGLLCIYPNLEHDYVLGEEYLGVCMSLPSQDEDLPSQDEEEESTPELQHTPPVLQNPLDGATVPIVIGRVIDAVLGLVGSLALIMFIYGGLIWMTATGNEQKVTKGKNTVLWAALGLVVVFSAYALVKFLFSALGV